MKFHNILIERQEKKSVPANLKKVLLIKIYQILGPYLSKLAMVQLCLKVLALQQASLQVLEST